MGEMMDVEVGDHKAMRRRAIVDAAIEIFAERGFHSARVSDIASAAGVADGTIYLYFRSKDDILITIFEEKMAEMIRWMQDALAPCNHWEERLRVFSTKHLDVVEQNPSLASVLQVELRLSNKFMKEYVPRRLQAYLDLVGDILIEGQKLGQIRADVNPVIVRRALFGALDEIAMQWVLSDRRYTLVDTARQVAEVFISGLRVEGRG